MSNRSESLAMSTSVLKALPGKLDIKRHSSSILYLPCGGTCKVQLCSLYALVYQPLVYLYQRLCTALSEQ